MKTENKPRGVLTVLLLAMFWSFGVNAELLTLAQNRETAYAIIHTAKEKEAALELKTHLDEITGANFILTEETSTTPAQSRAIYVGATAYAASCGIDFSAFRPQEWLVKRYGKDILIGGGKTRGTLYGVYELLENKLGCRWFAWDTTVIPKHDLLNVDLEELRDCPDFESRECFDDYYRAFFRGKDIFEKTQRFRKRIRSSLDYDTRFAVWPSCSKRYSDVHNFYDFVDPKKYFATHPEYFSMDAQGKRFHGTLGSTMQGGNFCLTHPEVEEIAWQSLDGYIRKDRAQLAPEDWPLMYDMTPMDSSPFLCLCPSCRKIIEQEGGDCGLLLHFLNRIASRLEKKYPDLTIRTAAYASTQKPPRTIRAKKNIIIKWCNLYGFNDCYRPITSTFNQDQKKELDAWKATGARLWARTYWNMGSHFFNPPRVETMIDAIAPDLRYYKEAGAISHFAEVHVDYDNHIQNFAHLQLYLGYKLMLDVSLDEEVIIRDFMAGYYGPAEKPLSAFLNQLRTAVRNEPARMRACTENDRPYCTEEFMERAWNFLSTAYEATEPGTLYREHSEGEMLAPLYVILQNTKWRFGDRQQMLRLYTEIRNKRIAAAYPDDSTGLRLKNELRERLESDLNAFVSLTLPVPKGFENRKVEMLGWPKLGWAHGRGKEMLVDDPDSITGKALITPWRKSNGADTTYLHDMSKEHIRGFTPLNFGAYDYVTKRSLHWNFKQDIPQDEKYHWYKLGNYELGSDSFAWGFFWNTRCDLSGLWSPADGLQDFNLWELWVSIKITGPAYVNDSTRKNEIYWDQVMLVKP